MMILIMLSEILFIPGTFQHLILENLLKRLNFAYKRRCLEQNYHQRQMLDANGKEKNRKLSRLIRKTELTNVTINPLFSSNLFQ